MQHTQTPAVRDLVLVGGGHSHVSVLKRFGMKPMPGVRLTLICRDVYTPYSGMLPGFIAGHYGYADAHIDLGPLSHFAGARFYHDEVTGLDAANHLIRCRHRPDMPYDLLSINIGSTPGFAGVPGAEKFVVPVKPINNFVQRWEQLAARVMETQSIMRIGVVGAGAGGVEVTLAVQYRLQAMLRDAGRSGAVPAFHLFSAGDTILPTHNRWVQRKFLRVFRQRGVEVHTNFRVAAAYADGIRSADGRTFALDETLWVTDAGAPRWLAESGLDLDAQGFIAVNDALQSVSHPDVFAAGDIAGVVNHPREKAGVFAVRQGRPLAANLRRVLLDQLPRPFRPQSTWLALISTGDQYAVASRGPLYLAGRAVWILKDWIDRRFVRQYNELPEIKI